MNKVKVLTSLVIITGGLVIGAKIAHAQKWVDACATNIALHGWWDVIQTRDHSCSTDYYTWNTTGTSSEESWVKSPPHYIYCGYSSLKDPGYVQARVYIPSPDSKQTRHANYYRWGTNTNYTIIGSVNQYSSFGWVHLNTLDWDSLHLLKLTDATSNEAKYTRHVDLDAISLTCP